MKLYQETKILLRSIPATVVTLFAVSGFLSVVIQWHHGGYRQTAQQMAQIGLRLVSEPLAPNL